MNKIDAHFHLINYTFQETNSFWKEEINSEGKSFDFDSQDIYKSQYDSMLGHKYVEEIALRESSNFRKETILELTAFLTENINLYEKYKSFFKGLEREKLRLDTYRKRKKSNLSDFDLTIELMSIIEPMDRDEYFTSTFYEEFGFLSTDYHHYIYTYSKKLLHDINENFKNYVPYGTNCLKTNKDPFFSMKLIISVFESCNGELFEPVSEYDFYKEFNFFHSTSKLKKIPSQKNKIYYLIHKLSETIDLQRRKNWIEGMLENLDLTSTTYNSKYRHIVSVEANDTSRNFASEIDFIIKQNQ